MDGGRKVRADQDPADHDMKRRHTVSDGAALCSGEILDFLPTNHDSGKR